MHFFGVTIIPVLAAVLFDVGRQDFPAAEFGPVAISGLMLAQMPDSEHFVRIGAAVAILSFAVWLIRGLIGLGREVRGDPEPRHNPAIHETYARKEDVSKVEVKLDHLEQDMNERFRKMAQDSSVRRKGIYDAVRALEQSSSRQHAHIEEMGHLLARLDNKIFRIWERLPNPPNSGGGP